MNVKELLQNKRVLAAVAALLVVILLICLVAGGDKAEKTVESFLKNAQKEKPEKIYKTLPKDLRNYLEDEDYEEDVLDMLEEMCESAADNADDQKFKVLKVVKMSEDALEEYEDTFDELGDEIDEKMKVQSGKYVIVMNTDEDGNVDVEVIDVIKVDGSWFVANLIQMLALSMY